MTSSANEAETTKSESEQDDVSETEQSKEMPAADDGETEIGSNEVEAHKNLCTEADEVADPDAELEELKNQLLRVMADNENLRKRTEREVAAAKIRAFIVCATCLRPWTILKKRFLIPEDKDDMDETLKNILIGVEMTGVKLQPLLTGMDQ